MRRIPSTLNMCVLLYPTDGSVKVNEICVIFKNVQSLKTKTNGKRWFSRIGGRLNYSCACYRASKQTMINGSHLPPLPPPNAVVTLSFLGQFDHCGFAADCGCGSSPSAPRIPPQYFVPPEAVKFVSVAELNEIGAELNAILANNFIPASPLCILDVVIPFSDTCIRGYYVSRSEKRLNEFIASINRKSYVSRNCHW
jgi:hypothetical protein